MAHAWWRDADYELFDLILKHLDEVSEDIRHAEKSIDEKITCLFLTGSRPWKAQNRTEENH
jgi:hypothetical protein